MFLTKSNGASDYCPHAERPIAKSAPDLTYLLGLLRYLRQKLKLFLYPDHIFTTPKPAVATAVSSSTLFGSSLLFLKNKRLPSGNY